MYTYIIAKIQILSPVIRAVAGLEASTYKCGQTAVFDVVEKTTCLGEIKYVLVGCLSIIFSGLIIIQQHLEKVEAM